MDAGVDELVRRQDTHVVSLGARLPEPRQIVWRVRSESTRARFGLAYAPTRLGPDSRLDPARTLDAFLEFWLHNADLLYGAATYPEAVVHLVLTAWLDRIANGGGRVEREYAAARVGPTFCWCMGMFGWRCS